MEARISKEVQFDAGHRVPGHRGKCRNLHGHRYRLVVVLEGDVSEEFGDPDEGMVVDFGDLKDILNRIANHYDHGFIYTKNDNAVSHFAITQQPGLKWVEIDRVPTAENLAGIIFNQVEEELDATWGKDAPFKLFKVQLWETPTSMAEVSNGPTT
jgi:6-pyruvoyltetrahydropterin/6-carboxytetrahydropterin synthase